MSCWGSGLRISLRPWEIRRFRVRRRDSSQALRAIMLVWRELLGLKLEVPKVTGMVHIKDFFGVSSRVVDGISWCGVR